MSTRPNILLITDDQHRYDAVAMHGAFPVRTPNLARLAAEGIWYRQAYSNCPLCMPARCSLHTGLYAHQHGLVQNVGHWPFHLPTMPQRLRQQGYATAAIGKLHVYEGVEMPVDLTRMTESIHALGYDYVHEVSGKSVSWYSDCEWTHHLARHGLLAQYRKHHERIQADGGKATTFPFANEHYVDVYIGDRCVEWLQKVDNVEPFFLWAGFVSPHFTIDAPRARRETVDPAALPPPIANDNPGDWLNKRRHYAAMIELVDQQIGRLLDVLDAKNLIDDTLVIFVSDHGEMLGDHGLSGKCYPHDPSIRVPLVARYPTWIEPGTISDAFVSLVDVTATVLDAAEADALPGSPGVPLSDHWQSSTQPRRDFAYSEDGGQFHPAFQMIRTDRWKYVLYVGDGRETLFDMQADPYELHDLAPDTHYNEIKAELKTRLIIHLAETPTPLAL